LGDPPETAKRIIELARKYEKRGAKLIVFPELCLTGYTAADLLYQSVLQKTAMEGLECIVNQSEDIDALLIIGMPLRLNSALFNAAVLIDRGEIAGIVLKSYIPSGNEFYERRWIAGADCLLDKEIKLFGKNVPIGTDILFVSKEDDTAVIAIEICEDLWVPIPPSSRAAIAGATIIVNLSASNELVGKAGYRRKLVEQQSGRCISAYVYCSAGVSESTTDTVFGGHCLIAENGVMLKESERFVQGPNGIIADLDTQVLALERSRSTSFAQSTREIANFRYRRIEVRLKASVPDKLERPNPRSLFVPENDEKRKEVCEEVFNIQTAGLSRRLRVMKGATGRGVSESDPHVVLGVSGGIDSTLAFLVCLEAYKKLGFDTSNIHLYSMPSGNTSQETKSNACLLGLAANIGGSEIPIHDVVKEILLAIRHDGITQDVAYENAQARARTLILMEMANIFSPSIVIGTGDLSELALGWYTFSGDQMSHYNVNSGVPKTLAQALIGWYAKTRAEPELAQVLEAILATPISPELTSGDDGKILQITEDIIGPYVLHDFFLPHLIRRGSSPKKILYLAKLAFSGIYSEAEIKKWLRVFLRRFFNSQFKRQVTIEGLRVGSVDLSTRSFWRMPSEATARQWLEDLEED
jgi:NAD+ synthase (glutamine-hydrolysing)